MNIYFLVVQKNTFYFWNTLSIYFNIYAICNFYCDIFILWRAEQGLILWIVPSQVYHFLRDICYVAYHFFIPVQPRSQSSCGSRGYREKYWHQQMYWYMCLQKTWSANSCTGTWIVPRLLLRYLPISENFANEAVPWIVSGLCELKKFL